MEVKRVEGEIHSRLLSADPKVKDGKLAGTWTRVADCAAGILGSHSVVVWLQEDWAENYGDWGSINVASDARLAAGYC